MKQHYKTLGIEEGSSQDVINEAYFCLRKKLNPANNDNQEFFIEEYKKVQAAYNALSNISILATEQGVNSLKVELPKQQDKKTIINKTPIKKPLKIFKPKKIMKRVFLITSILIVLGIAVFTWWFSQTELNNLVYSQSETKWAKNDISNDIVYLKKTMIPFNGTLTKYKTGYSGKFINGKKNGLHREFSYSRVAFEGYYIEGLPEGAHKRWNYDQLVSEVNYKNGKRVGLSKKWNKEGLLIDIDYNQNEIVKYLQDYLRTSDNLNLIEGSYRVNQNNVTDYEFTIINLNGQFYGVITNRFRKGGNIQLDATLFDVGDIKFFASKTADIDKFNATWFMANRSLKKYELNYNIVKNQIKFPNGYYYQKQ